MSEEITAATVEEKSRLTKEQRSQIAKDAAKRRWAKAKRAASRPKSKSKAKAKPAKKIAPTSPREFSSALRRAESDLAKALEQRATHAAQYNYHAAQYSAINKQIPALQNLVSVLKNPLGVLPDYPYPAAPSVEQIVSDQPLQYRNPLPVRPVPVEPPPALHPAMTAGRAQGGAVDAPGDLAADTEDEDQFLRDAQVAGGQWH